MEKVRDRFDQLAGSYATRRFAWLCSWWQAYQSQHTSLHILSVTHDGSPVAFLPLYLDREQGRNELKLLGSGKACSDDLGLYAESAHVDTSVQMLVRSLRQSGEQGLWTRLEFDGVRNDNVVMNRFLLKLRQDFGADFFERIDQPCRVVTLHENFEKYLQNEVSRSQRTFLRKCIRDYLDNGRAPSRLRRLLMT